MITNIVAPAATLPVIFRTQRENGFLWVTAVFPTLRGTADPATFTIYQHVGQHGTGTRGWYARTRPATEPEYASLLSELQGIYGTRHHEDDQIFILRVVERMTRQHDRIRQEDCR